MLSLSLAQSLKIQSGPANRMVKYKPYNEETCKICFLLEYSYITKKCMLEYIMGTYMNKQNE